MLNIVEFMPRSGYDKENIDDRKFLCDECIGIVSFASSPESWKYTDTAKEQAKRLYYFDKK